ncbi:MAG: AraC family transcriptional regulator [Ignavibacteriae bacterium HGW-Ignavibacteriae-3]|nr:MAG: AraC family transcriptional regulator [Ignavibacteriae bacterium HGW-Ignavibacteriae-3]
MKSNKILYIKNMVCNRCIKVVGEEFDKLGIATRSISLGEVETEQSAENLPLGKIKEVLAVNGFELIEDKKARLIERIKKFIIKIIYEENSNISENHKFSILIEKELGLDYNYLSSLFSSRESITIEQYIILQKIEHAKELLKYGELTLSEIAYKLGYSSVQHLSSQFKKTTGFTASQFKVMTENMRKPLDKIH